MSQNSMAVPQSLQMATAAMKIKDACSFNTLSRHYIANKGPSVFPVVMYGCESWPIKKAECQRIDGFELWCWRSLLRVAWTAKRSNQSVLKEIIPEYSLEG